MIAVVYMKNVCHSSLLYIYAYKLTLGLVKMSMFEQRTPFEIHFQNWTEIGKIPVKLRTVHAWLFS
jgi:hypothetical protein